MPRKTRPLRVRLHTSTGRTHKQRPHLLTTEPLCWTGMDVFIKWPSFMQPTSDWKKTEPERWESSSQTGAPLKSHILGINNLIPPLTEPEAGETCLSDIQQSSSIHGGQADRASKNRSLTMYTTKTIKHTQLHKIISLITQADTQAKLPPQTGTSNWYTSELASWSQKWIAATIMMMIMMKHITCQWWPIMPQSWIFVHNNC